MGFGAELGRIGGCTDSLCDPGGATGFSPRVSYDITRHNLWGLGHSLSLRTRVSRYDRRGILNVAIAQHPVTPSYPLRTIQYAAMMTLLLCLTLGISAAFVADSIVPSFRTADEVARYLDVPVLACLPKGEPI